MGSLSNARQRWTLERQKRREPSLYDEWLNEEKLSSQQQQQQQQRHQTPPPPPLPESDLHQFSRPLLPLRSAQTSTSTLLTNSTSFNSPLPSPSTSHPLERLPSQSNSDQRPSSASTSSPQLLRRGSAPLRQQYETASSSYDRRRDTIRAVTPDSISSTFRPSSSSHFQFDAPASNRVPRPQTSSHSISTTTSHQTPRADLRRRDDPTSANRQHDYDEAYDAEREDITKSSFTDGASHAPLPRSSPLPIASPSSKAILDRHVAAMARSQPLDLSPVPSTNLSPAERQLHTPTTASAPSNKRFQMRNPSQPRERDMRYTPQSSPSVAGKTDPRTTPSRSRSRSQADWLEKEQVVATAAASAARPRTRTIDDRAHSNSSTPSSTTRSRNRVASIPTSLYQGQNGVQYLATVPTQTSSPATPSLASVSRVVPSHSQQPIRTESPTPLDSTASSSSPNSAIPARRIVHLMKTFNGKLGGNIVFRRGFGQPWCQSYCSISGENASLMYEVTSEENVLRTLVSDLRGCLIKTNSEADIPHIEITPSQSRSDVHLRFATQADFDAWYATFLYWQRQPTMPPHPPTSRPRTSSIAADAVSTPPDLAPRPASTRPRDRHNSISSTVNARRQSVVPTIKEAPVIKIGKMIFWDTHAGLSSAHSKTASGHASNVRPEIQRLQSYGSKRWLRVSGQLRENGELKLHADTDDTLISIVQLSQLSRCAIQRLDHSVLDCDFCIAIYPQYTASPTTNQAAFLRPLFLSLESRVLYEVWFVLLRAFTIPQLYGPSNAIDPPNSSNGLDEQQMDLEQILATATTDMFRVERSLSVRVVEAKLYPAFNNIDNNPPPTHNRSQNSLAKTLPDGFFAEISLDNETRGRTSVKRETLSPLWGETFEFLDLPSVLSSASILIKKRLSDPTVETRNTQDPAGFAQEQTAGVVGFTRDIMCGKVEIHIHELEDTEKEVEKWWPIFNSSDIQIGEILIKARADEGVILMARDYQPLSDLLHRFTNSLPLHIAQMISGELKRLSDCLLDIFQVSGRVSDWIMALVEEEIDGLHKDNSITRTRYANRIGSNEAHDAPGSSAVDRDVIVRDLNKSASVEANLLFRGNTLLTKSLDTHMRRVGKEYLEESLAATIQNINDADPDCEVNPNNVSSPGDADRNWKRLMYYTQQVWSAIVAAKHKCPVELRVIFRHIRACAEDRYGDFLRAVSFSSVSGFLFLRFFCPAVLNPNLFGLIKGDIKPKARRTLTLIAKSLQTMANMATFGTKEHWMVPMNAFLVQHRDGFKAFIDDVCYVPSLLASNNKNASAQHSATVMDSDAHLSYTTPMTIMQRLPPTSREGFPSLPYLLDQARAFADLVQLWLEVVNPLPSTNNMVTAQNLKRRTEALQTIKDVGGDLALFHDACVRLNTRTQDCLNRAERAERPNSSTSFPWEDLIDQLHGRDTHTHSSDDEKLSTRALATRPDPNNNLVLPIDQTQSNATSLAYRSQRWTPRDSQDDDRPLHYSLNQTTSLSESARSHEYIPPFERGTHDRPGSSGLHAAASALTGNIRRVLQSRGSDHSPSASNSNISSAVTSDAEHTTALPSYDREVRRHRERREAAKVQIQQHVEEAKAREREKEKRKKTPLAALRKRKDKSTNDADSQRMNSVASHGTAM